MTFNYRIMWEREGHTETVPPDQMFARLGHMTFEALEDGSVIVSPDGNGGCIAKYDDDTVVFSIEVVDE